MVGRGTGSGRYARQEYRSSSNSSSTPIRSSVLCRPAGTFLAASGMSASLGRNFVERDILVDPDVAGQAEHALGDDVAEDFVGAAGNAHRRRRQQHGLELAGRL